MKRTALVTAILAVMMVGNVKLGTANPISKLLFAGT